MSLSRPHPMWTMAESPYEVSKACTVATMLSGRYVTDHRARYWSASNPSGFCQLCLISGYPETPGTLEHQLLNCPATSETRLRNIYHWSNYMTDKPEIFKIVQYHSLTQGPEGESAFMQLLLDPTACATVIKAAQVSGEGVLSHLLYLTRTWCHSLHLKRKRLLKLYNIIWQSEHSFLSVDAIYTPVLHDQHRQLWTSSK